MAQAPAMTTRSSANARQNSRRFAVDQPTKTRAQRWPIALPHAAETTAPCPVCGETVFYDRAHADDVRCTGCGLLLHEERVTYAMGEEYVVTEWRLTER